MFHIFVALARTRAFLTVVADIVSCIVSWYGRGLQGTTCRDVQTSGRGMSRRAKFQAATADNASAPMSEVAFSPPEDEIMIRQGLKYIIQYYTYCSISRQQESD